MLEEQDYFFLQKLLRDNSGLALTDGKEYLIEVRLLPVAQSLGFSSLQELVQSLRVSRSGIALERVIDAMTTNETLFFRDGHPFSALTEVILPSFTGSDTSRNTIRIWSAAASAGQEPYSIAIQLAENSEMWADTSVEIVASDISEEMICKAQIGIYTEFEVKRGLSEYLLKRYFEKCGANWQICSQIRSMVEFRKLNLLEDFQSLGLFDIIFCRNVLIYFDNSTKIDVVERLVRQLRRDGFFVVGGAETLVGVTDKLCPCSEHRGLYRPSNDGSGRMQRIGETVDPRGGRLC